MNVRWIITAEQFHHVNTFGWPQSSITTATSKRKWSHSFIVRQICGSNFGYLSNATLWLIASGEGNTMEWIPGNEFNDNVVLVKKNVEYKPLSGPVFPKVQATHGDIRPDWIDDL